MLLSLEGVGGFDAESLSSQCDSAAGPKEILVLSPVFPSLL